MLRTASICPQPTLRVRAARACVTVAALAAALLAACDKKEPTPIYPGIVLGASPLTTAEGGANVPFGVSLRAPPSANVTVVVTSTDTTEGRLIAPGGATSSSYVNLTFTPDNWSVVQTVQVVPVQDSVVDGNVTYTITLDAGSTDPAYSNLPVATLSVTNADDDVPSLTVSTATATTSESVTTTTTFTVRLNTQPTGTVTVPVQSSDTTEVLLRGGDSPSTAVATIHLTFTTTNYATSQTVTLVGQNDPIDDGNQVVGVQVGPPTGAAEYAVLGPQTVSVTNLDDDTAAITVVPSATPLVTSENGTTATFTVRLNTQPTSDVTLAVTSGNVAEGVLSSGSQNGVETASLVFDATNWSTPQTVTVTGQDEVGTQVGGDNVAYDVTVGPATGATEYTTLATQAVAVLNLDNDTPAIIVPEAGGAPLQTRESGTGTTATFSLRLNKAPTADVVVPVTTSDATEGLVRGGSSPTIAQASVNVTFTTADWQTPQTITVVGQPDSIVDGTQGYSVAVGPATSADAAFGGVSGPSVSLTSIDTDVVGFTVSTTTLTHTEGGVAVTFTVRLNTIPSADVVIPVTSSNPAEGLVSGGSLGTSFGSTLSLTFTAADWNTPQTVSVKGPTDDVDDGNRTYTLTVGPPSSADAAYAALASKAISATNVDVDVAGLTVTPTIGLATTEAGGTATFTVQLNSKPTANVTIPVTSGDASEALVSTASSVPATALSLAFTAADWNVPQTVTVTGQQDTLVDGARPFTITLGAPTSTDTKYSTLAARTVTGSNADDEVGVPEGTIDAPIAPPAVPYDGQTGPGAPSYYVLTVLPSSYVVLSGPSQAVTFTVDDDGTYATPICAQTTVAAGGTGVCYVAAGGTVYVRVTTTATQGAGYTLNAYQQFTFSSTDVPKSITDYATVYSNLNVTGAPTAITKVTVTLSISHTWGPDLDIYLQAPDGTEITLSTDNGGSGGYSNVTFDDATVALITSATGLVTGTWRPEVPLSGLNGKNANGLWRLRVYDDAGLDSGTLTAFSLTIR